MQLGSKFRRADHKRAGPPRRVDHFMIRGHHRAILAEYSRESLNHLVGPLTAFRIDDLDPRLELPMLRPQAALPSIEHDGDSVTLSPAVPGQVPDQRLTCRLQTTGPAGPRHSGAADKVIAIDKKMCRHLELRSLSAFVDNTTNI